MRLDSSSRASFSTLDIAPTPRRPCASEPSASRTRAVWHNRPVNGRKTRYSAMPHPGLATLPPARRGTLPAGRRRAHGVGRRYLIQHSAGSGKSNSIAWLAHQLIGLTIDDVPVFDSIIVVTHRRILDRQIRDTIRQYAQVSATVGHADRSGDLRRFIEIGKKIIISTVQKFPFILDEIGNDQRRRSFANIIDEAHSSRGGRTSAAMAQALSAAGTVNEEETYEDQVSRLMETRMLLPNASYFAFTATPKNKTLEFSAPPSRSRTARSGVALSTATP